MVESRTSTSEINIEYMNSEELMPDPGNPRFISTEQLAALTKSIEEFGFVDPVIAHVDSKIVIAGHQRIIAARRLGIKQVPTIFLNLDDDKARVLGIALNRIDGEFDQELLARLLADIETSSPSIDLSVTGIAEDELTKLLIQLDIREKRERPESFDFVEAFEKARISTRSALGDVWILGEHRIICGDSTDQVVVDQLFGEDRPRMTFTDPPFGVDFGRNSTPSRKRSRKIKNDGL